MKSYFDIATASAVNSSDSHWLILQHGAGLMGYILYSTDSKSIIRSRLWLTGNDAAASEEIIDLIKSETLAVSDIAKVIMVNYHTGYFALPDLFFQEDKINHWIDFMIGNDPGEKILINEAVDNAIVHVHPIDKGIHTQLVQQFPGVVVRALQEFAFFGKRQEGDLLYLTFLNQYIFVTLYSNNQLLLNQGYSFKSPEDVLYLLLNITDQFLQDKTSLSIIPEGFIDADSSLYKLLDAYFPKIEIPETSGFDYPENALTVSPFILRHIDRIITCVS